jgi:hypothetical protein
MQLYQTQTSAASTILTIFTAKYFGGSSKAKAYVEGRKDSKCKTISGNGKTGYDWCKTTYTFFCELNDKGNYLVTMMKVINFRVHD